MKRRALVLPAGSLVSGVLALPDTLAHHVRDVLRLGEGATLDLFDGDGWQATASITGVDKRRVLVRIEATTRAPPPPGPAITLLQGLGKGDKLDQVARQATELGVAALVPVLSLRAVPRAQARVDRWRTIAEDALRVSGRAWRPRISEPRALAEVLAAPRAELALCLAPSATRGLAEILPPHAPASVEVLIGPEGGLEDAEIAAAEAAGFRLASLGPYVLRTETAGPALVAILGFWGGAFGAT